MHHLIHEDGRGQVIVHIHIVPEQLLEIVAKVQFGQGGRSILKDQVLKEVVITFAAGRLF